MRVYHETGMGLYVEVYPDLSIWGSVCFRVYVGMVYAVGWLVGWWGRRSDPPGPSLLRRRNGLLHPRHTKGVAALASAIRTQFGDTGNRETTMRQRLWANGSARDGTGVGYETDDLSIRIEFSSATQFWKAIPDGSTVPGWIEISITAQEDV